MKVRSQLRQRHPTSDRYAVVDDMKSQIAKIHDTPTGMVGDPGVPDVPFFWNCPVEHRSAGRHLCERKWDDLPQPAQRIAKAVSGNATADGEQLGDQIVHRSTDFSGDLVSRCHAPAF